MTKIPLRAQIKDYALAQEKIKQNEGAPIAPIVENGQPISTVWEFANGELWIEEFQVEGYQDQYRLIQISSPAEGEAQ